VSSTATVLRAMLCANSSFKKIRGGGEKVKRKMREEEKEGAVARKQSFMQDMKNTGACTRMPNMLLFSIARRSYECSLSYLLRCELYMAGAAQALRSAAVEFHFRARQLIRGRQQASAQGNQTRMLGAGAAEEPPAEAAVMAAHQEIVEKLAALKAHRGLVVAHPMAKRAEVFRAPIRNLKT